MALTTVSGNSSFVFPFSDIPSCFFPMHFQKWCSGCPSLGRIMENQGKEENWGLQIAPNFWLHLPYPAAIWCSPGPHLVFYKYFHRVYQLDPLPGPNPRVCKRDWFLLSISWEIFMSQTENYIPQKTGGGEGILKKSTSVLQSYLHF